MRAIVCFPVLLAGCFPGDYTRPEDPALSWMYDRGAAGSGMKPCLRIAAVLRAECDGDTTCERAVSEDLSYHCYAGSYRAPKGEQDGPCTGSADRDDTAICKELALAPDLTAHCVAELRFYRSDMCLRGDPTLTGVGP
jgi:hypothetical protein